MPTTPIVNREESDRTLAFEFFTDRKSEIIENRRWLEGPAPVGFRNQAAHAIMATIAAANVWWCRGAQQWRSEFQQTITISIKPPPRAQSYVLPLNRLNDNCIHSIVRKE